MSNIKRIEEEQSKTIVEWFLRNMKQDSRTQSATAGSDDGGLSSSLPPSVHYTPMGKAEDMRNDDKDENATTLLALLAVIMVFAAVMLGLLLRAVEAAASYQGVL